MQGKGLLVAQEWVKEYACLAGDTGETQARSLSQNYPLEEEMAAHSSILYLEKSVGGELGGYSP